METHAGAYTHAGLKLSSFYKSIYYANYNSYFVSALRLAKAKGTMSNSDYQRYLLELELIPEKVQKLY